MLGIEDLVGALGLRIALAEVVAAVVAAVGGNVAVDPASAVAVAGTAVVAASAVFVVPATVAAFVFAAGSSVQAVGVGVVGLFAVADADQPIAVVAAELVAVLVAVEYAAVAAGLVVAAAAAAAAAELVMTAAEAGAWRRGVIFSTNGEKRVGVRQKIVLCKDQCPVLVYYNMMQ